MRYLKIQELSLKEFQNLTERFLNKFMKILLMKYMKINFLKEEF